MAMPHIKSYVRHQGHQAGWVMIGSHNLSKAAWGSLIKGGSKLMIRSYELSVLLMPHLEAAYLGHPARGFRCARALGQAAAAGNAEASAAGPLRTLGQAATASTAAEAAAAVVAGTAADTAAAGSHRVDSAAGGGTCVDVEFWGFPGNDSKMSQEREQPGSSSSSGVIPMFLPLPFELPPPRYQRGGGGGGDEPWTNDTLYSGVDAIGRQCGQPGWALYGLSEGAES